MIFYVSHVFKFIVYGIFYYVVFINPFFYVSIEYHPIQPLQIETNISCDIYVNIGC